VTTSELPASGVPTLETARPLRLCLFGAAGDTGNLGVSALMHSVLGGVARHAPDAEVTVFDNGWGVRPAAARAEGKSFAYRRCGARMSRRYHRPESYANMRAAHLLGGLWNAGARAMRRADAIWDISGGDSFADIYGDRHLRAIAEPKRLALHMGRPLVLLPQTYGPFRTKYWRGEAAMLLRRSALAWARDERSFAAMKELLGTDFDPSRHRAGVDVAFALESYEPGQPLPEPVGEWLRAGDRPLVGINVSGLIYNDPGSRERFELTLDYRELLESLVRRFLDETDARVLLLSHVLPTEVKIESDHDAASDLRERLEPALRERVALTPPDLDQSETKWVIGKLDWFCGTRMHATIGAMSNCVPTAGLAYSIKMQGVFETCGQGESMADLRGGDTASVLAQLWRSWGNRAQARRVLQETIPAVRELARNELFETLEVSARDVR
jgi:polysaccharide pyruvyl transferase WcaK-like protein